MNSKLKATRNILKFTLILVYNNINLILAPKFNGHPALSTRGSAQIGKTLTISGCNVTAPFELKPEQCYYLKDGVKRMNASVTNSGGITTFRQLVLPNADLSTQGYYECVVFIPNIMSQELKSKKLDIQFNSKYIWQ